MAKAKTTRVRIQIALVRGEKIQPMADLMQRDSEADRRVCWADARVAEATGPRQP